MAVTHNGVARAGATPLLPPSSRRTMKYIPCEMHPRYLHSPYQRLGWIPYSCSGLSTRTEIVGRFRCACCAGDRCLGSLGGFTGGSGRVGASCSRTRIYSGTPVSSALASRSRSLARSRASRASTRSHPSGGFRLLGPVIRARSTLFNETPIRPARSAKLIPDVS